MNNEIHSRNVHRARRFRSNVEEDVHNTMWLISMVFSSACDLAGNVVMFTARSMFMHSV